MELTVDKRLLLMFEAWSNQTTELIKCNGQIIKIKEWTEKLN